MMRAFSSKVPVEIRRPQAAVDAGNNFEPRSSGRGALKKGLSGGFCHVLPTFGPAFAFCKKDSEGLFLGHDKKEVRP